MSKFKVGDKVRWVNTEYTNYEIERVGDVVVREVTEHGNLYFHGVLGGAWYAGNFELAKSQIINNILNEI